MDINKTAAFEGAADIDGDGDGERNNIGICKCASKFVLLIIIKASLIIGNV